MSPSLEVTMHQLTAISYLVQVVLNEDILCVSSLMEICKDRDTVASRILNVFRHEGQHPNLLNRLTEKEILKEGLCCFLTTM